MVVTSSMEWNHIWIVKSQIEPVPNVSTDSVSVIGSRGCDGYGWFT